MNRYRGHGGKYKYEHVRVAEAALGKPLPAGVEVHHVNGNKRENVNRNLVICQDRAYHALLHVRQRVRAAGGDPNTERICGRCGEVKAISEFSPAGAHRTTTCRLCAAEYLREWRHAQQRKAG